MKRLRMVSKVMILVMAYHLLYPVLTPLPTYALTSGPTQPEVQAFEPVGTSDMVDMFSGDFVYNIPLLDVEGYPVNISYHGGVTMEQEASWVGLGWNINPGAITRSVRGVPDDFKGDTLAKELHIKDEKTLRAGMGVMGEFFGVGDPLLNISANLGTNVNVSNYRGVSVDFSFGVGVSLFRSVSAGVNVGVGSQTGAEIDYNAGLQLSTSQILSTDMAGGIGVNYGQGYSTRSGLKDASFTVSTNVKLMNSSTTGPTLGGAIPIALKNYVPVITNSSTMQTIYARIKVGGEVAWCNVDLNINCMLSKVHYNDDGSRDAYGYLYYQNADNNKNSSILDFTRDRDGMFNKTMQYLPPGNMTYDIYSVSGQGTGGMFRPFRNDFGSVYDPYTISKQEYHSGQAEASIGWLFGAGGDASVTNTELTSGPWKKYNNPYTPKSKGIIYEDVYFKQGGELTQLDPNFFSSLGGYSVIDGSGTVGFSRKGSAIDSREPRANYISYFNAEEASVAEVASDDSIRSYSGFTAPYTKQSYPRYENTGAYKRKKYHISEVVQTQTDGRRYIYGIPAMNNVSREATFSVDADPSSNGLVDISDAIDSKNNDKGMENYFSSTITPAYAHSYLLTSVLSTDYVDVTGDGPTDDDLGDYTKFNYHLKDKDFRWRAPAESGKGQYNPGYLSDKQDDKANYVIGSREQWVLHSIESKNFIAEFHISDSVEREDAQGVKDKIKGVAGYDSPLSQNGTSPKLDYIVLYNKHDRFVNGAAAVPIKTVSFVYDYSLCKGVPNQSDTTHGKLTLKRIYIKYGSSDKSMASPYQFEYNDNGTLNPDYNIVDKDRWGNYKPSDSLINNFEFPFVKQTTETNDYANVWSLKKITLPSGGSINVDYESDDYAFVQDKIAMDMFKVEGIGNSAQKQDRTTLYSDRNTPNLYAYFKRRIGEELNPSSIQQSYLKGLDCVYYNFNIELRDGKYEQVKGYAQIESAGICPNDNNYAYIKMKKVDPKGNAHAHPAAYTALNIGRYNIPQVFFPGSDPDQPDIKNVLSGLKQSFDEMVSIGKNPIIQFLNKGWAKNVNLAKCYIRLNDPSMRKKGGGQRVKSLIFDDSWQQQSGNTNVSAQYGKRYDYTIKDPGYGIISSGVASYEPLIGGDENPFRLPAKFTVQNGSKWPPNDPVDLYQELPIAESLLPSPTVGYRQITVTSIHKDKGRSSQGIDVYQFYTAKDFPFEIKNTAIDKLTDENKYSLFEQKNVLEATQGYTVILNDMHGKPLSVQHFVDKNGNRELINSQVFEYYTNGTKLNNYVPVLKHNKANMQMERSVEQLGVEVDLTIDSREKTEHSKNDNFNANVNGTNIVWAMVVIPLGFPWSSKYNNEFRSVVATKIVQQYGILKTVKNFNEGALTSMTNEAFDPLTGQPVITSINNEFNDMEYNVGYPAYWGVKGMGPSYVNTKFEEDIDSIQILANTDSSAFVNTPNLTNYRVGDELLLSYNGNKIIAWVMGFPDNDGLKQNCCRLRVKPRYPSNTPGWSGIIYNVNIKIIRSGCKNQLNENILSYASMKLPFKSIGGVTALNDTLTDLVSIHGRLYTDDKAKVITTQADPKTLNEFAKGQKGKYRLVSEYDYVTDRRYLGNGSRNAGLFSALSLWTTVGSYLPVCNADNGITIRCSSGTEATTSYMQFSPSFPWNLTKAVTSWSPFATEVENITADSIYSTAAFGYNEGLPTAVVANARQGEILAEGFEDYRLLLVSGSLMQFFYSPFKSLFSTQTLGSSQYAVFNITPASGPQILKGSQISNGTAHSGLYCFKTGTGITLNIPVTDLNLSTADSLYRTFTFKKPATGQKQKYILSFWLRPISVTGNETTYPAISSPATISYSGYAKLPSYTTNIIEKWQKAECVFEVSSTISTVALKLPANLYIDDIRIHPYDANMKSFVYHPFSERLMATLDENNFATFYEYDQEGNLVRVKKETEQGIMTLSESRSAHPKK